MARGPRHEAADALHHVVPKGNDGRPIVADDRDRTRLIARLTDVAEASGWVMLAWSLLSTHLHLLLRTPEPNLGEGMQRLLGGYSRGYHVRHGGRGSLFEPRFWSRPIVDEAQLLRTALYVDLNPVAAGLATHPASYPWCSYARDPSRPWLVDVVGATPEAATAAWAEIVDDASRRLRDARTPLPAVAGSIVAAHAAPSGFSLTPNRTSD